MKKAKRTLAVVLAVVVVVLAVGVGAYVLGRNAQLGTVQSEEESGSGIDRKSVV